MARVDRILGLGEGTVAENDGQIVVKRVEEPSGGIQTERNEAKPEGIQTSASAGARRSKAPVTPQPTGATVGGATFPEHWDDKYYHPARPASAYLRQSRSDMAEAREAISGGIQVQGEPPGLGATGGIKVERETPRRSAIGSTGDRTEPVDGVYTFLWWRPGRVPADKHTPIDPATAATSLQFVNGRVLNVRPDGVLEVKLDGEESPKQFITANTAVSATFEANWNAVRQADAAR